MRVVGLRRRWAPVGTAFALLALAIPASADARTVYVANGFSDSVTPIDTATNTAEPPIGVEASPRGVAIVPDQPPRAAFTASVATIGLATGFDASASTDPDGAVARYDWAFGDGAMLADGGPTPTHAYAAAGRDTAELTVTDDEGCSSELVFTGQTAHCNGGPAAVASNELTIATPPGSTTPTPTPAPTPTPSPSPTEESRPERLPRCLGRRATIVAQADGPTRGTPRADVIVGTRGRDRIRSLGGNDRVCARGAGDSIDAGAGNDRVSAGPGHDTIRSGSGNDRLNPGAGRDRVSADPSDRMSSCETVHRSR